MLAVAPYPNPDSNSDGCSNNQRYDHPGPFERSLSAMMAEDALFRRVLRLTVDFRK